MFEPEKIERIRFRENWRDPFVGEYVEADDYDQLLALYREHVPAVPCYVCGKEAKDTKAKVKDTGEAVCMDCWNSAPKQ